LPTLAISKKRFVGMLTLTAAALSLSSLCFNAYCAYFGLDDVRGIRIVNLAREGSAPTYYSALLLAIAALLLLTIGSVESTDDVRCGRW
jgi:hypothetical protein